MKKDILSGKVEVLNRTMDGIATRRFHSDRSEPFIRNGEEHLLRVFPVFIGICLVVFLASIIALGDLSLAKVIEILCLTFLCCFAILGIPCLLMMSCGPFRLLGVILGAFIMSVIMWVACEMADANYFPQATLEILDAVNIHITGAWANIVGFLGTYAFILFTPIAVLSVISAYLCRYMPRVFRAMNAHAENGVRGKAEGFFMVPDIIDVRRVVLEPETDNHVFDLRDGLSITTYLFILGLIISSYLFVNPFFLDSMSWRTMLAISLMLAMFAPALIIPWQIVRSVGAKVVSDAPRKYDLWIGAKKRLMSAFMTLGAFMMMFLISVYLGNDPADIFRTYLTYLIPLMTVSIVYGMLCANNFQRQNRDLICRRFDEGDL